MFYLAGLGKQSSDTGLVHTSAMPSSKRGAVKDPDPSALSGSSCSCIPATGTFMPRSLHLRPWAGDLFWCLPWDLLMAGYEGESQRPFSPPWLPTQHFSTPSPTLSAPNPSFWSEKLQEFVIGAFLTICRHSLNPQLGISSMEETKREEVGAFSRFSW